MSLAKLFVEVGANVNNFERGMKQVRSDIDQTAKQASMFSNTLSTAIGFGLANAATRGISALVNLGKSAVETGLNFNSLEQNSTLAFETMLGSIDKAKAFLADLKQFAKTTPFELPGLIESSQRLLAFGFEAKQIIPMMTSIGDAVAGLGGSPEKLNRVILAFGQIKAKGKIMAGEMLQLTEAGIPAWDMLAKKIGVSIPEAMKLGEKGMIDADTAITAILEGMTKKFGGLMAKQSTSWTGMLSNIKDTFTQVTGRVFKPFFDLGLKGMQQLLKLFDSPIFEGFVQKLTKGTNFLASLIGRVGKGFIGLFSGDFKSFFGGLFGNFDKLNKMLSKYENKRFGWLSNFTPKEALTAINGFINDLKHGGKNLQYWIDHTPRLLQPLQKITIKAMDVWKYLAGEGIQATLKKLGSILTGLGSILARLVRPFKEALGSLFQQLSTMKNLGFADIFKAVLSSIASAFMGFLKVIQTEFWPTIKNALVWVWNALTSFIGSINWSDVWQSISSVFSSLYDYVSKIDWSGIGQSISNLFSTIVGYVSSIDWSSVWSTIWSGLTAVGTFISENVFPIFTGFFNWLVSWFTDSSKRQTLFNAINATWTFITEWASYLWDVISPYLSSFWSNLVDWSINRAFPSLVNWSVAFTSWAVGLWSNHLAPKLVSWWNSFESWMGETFPKTKEPLANLRSNFIWLFDELALFIGIRSGSIKKDWSAFFADFFSISKLNLDQVLANIIQLGANIIGGLTNIVYIFRKLVQGDWQAAWDEVKRIAVMTWDFLKSHFNFDGPDSQAIIQGVRSLGDAIYNAISGALHGIGKAYDDLVVQPIRNATTGLINNLNNLISSLNSFSGISLPTISLPQFATGGITSGGIALVGEKGPEVVEMPRGSRVWDHGQSMGMLNQSEGQSITIVIRNEGALPTDRRTIDEIAVALQRRLNLQGNRFVLA